MESPESSYAPQSPDLSAPSPPETIHPQHQSYRGSVSHISPFALPPTANPSPTHTLADPLVPAFLPPPGSAVPSQTYPASSPFAPQTNYKTPVYANPVYAKPDYDMPPRRAAAVAAVAKMPQHDDDPMDEDEEEVVAPKRRQAKRVKVEEPAPEPESRAPGVQEGIEVRTKFPVARIKRIMQADEDVGKVAQVTPVVVSKALELFMISLVGKAAEEAKARSSKRVLSSHLKQAVQKDEQFDFLSEIVSKVADAPAPATRGAKTEDMSEEGEEEAPTPAPKKKRAAPGTGTRRRKKVEAEE